MSRWKFFLACVLLMTGPMLAASSLAAELGDDGLHKPSWLRETFKDLREDLSDANSENKRLLLIVEQRGCIYCTKMHEEVFSDPGIEAFIRENYYVVQLNLFGDIEVTDFDGTVLPEKEMAIRWGVMFTPTLIFLPEDVGSGLSAQQAAVAAMPGAFGKGTTSALLNWIVDHGYQSGEHFQKFLARQMAIEN
ncbi:MAG: thioredoxin family protein [Rhizobium sp.]|nr:thioredoxin family protein [Rhizobium sp.]